MKWPPGGHEAPARIARCAPERHGLAHETVVRNT